MKDVYSALGNETRVKLVLCLAKKSKNVSEMIQICGLAQSAVSQHLVKLKKAGLVKTTKKGKEIFYSVANKKVIHISSLLAALQKEII